MISAVSFRRVSTMMNTYEWKPRERIHRQSSRPFMPGIIQSVMTMRNDLLKRMEAALFPSRAVTTSCPLLVSASFRSSRDVSSLSTARILIP
jgi:hypothetical protein